MNSMRQEDVVSNKWWRQYYGGGEWGEGGRLGCLVGTRVNCGSGPGSSSSG